jgi:hypothetical protein
MRISWSIGSATSLLVPEGSKHRCLGRTSPLSQGRQRSRRGSPLLARSAWLRLLACHPPPPHRQVFIAPHTSGGVGNELQEYGPARRRDNLCCGNRFQSCSCKRRPARPAGSAPAGHDEELLSWRPIWFWQIGRVRWRQIFRRLILAPMDDSLPYRPSVLLRLCGRRRTTTGSATAWRLRR